MELYTKRYNLYNYLIRDNFDYINTIQYIYLWRNSLIILFTILTGIFMYHYNNIDLFALFIIGIIIIFIYIIYFEVTIYISEIVNNKHLLNYKYYYEVMNSLFIENYDFTKDDDINDNKLIINKPEDLLSITPTILAKYDASIEGNYLQIKVDDNDYFQEFLRNNFFLYDKNRIHNNIYIIVDDVTFENKKIKIDNLFIRSSTEYKYLIRTNPDATQKYFIQNGYFKFNISNDILTEEYYNLKFHIIEKMYYLFIKPINNPQTPNTTSSGGTYTIIVNDINAVNDKIISSIATLKNSRTFSLLRYENSDNNYLYEPTTLNLKITDKQGLINYIITNQYYNYTGNLTITDVNYPRDVDFLTSISYYGIYENTDAYFKVNINTNDSFYNEMNRDYDSYLNLYILNGAISFIDMNTNDIYSINGIMHFNIGKFFNKYFNDYVNINPVIKEIPIIKHFYNSLYQNSAALIYNFKSEAPGTSVGGVVKKPKYDNENGIVTFETGSYLTTPKAIFNTNSNKIYSFSFWFKTTDNKSIIEYVSNDNSVKFRVKKNDNNLIFDINIGSGDKKKKYSITAKDLNFNEWHNVIIIIDLSNAEKSKVSLYVDGKSIETKELFFFLIALAVAAGVAASRSREPNYEDLTFTETKLGDFNGQMKDFRIYTRNLNDDDIKNLYAFNKGIVVNNDFIRNYKDIYVYLYQKTSYIITKENGKLVINKGRLNEYLSHQVNGRTINEYLKKINRQLELYARNIDIINKKTTIINAINTNAQIILALTLNNITDTSINENRNIFIRNIIFNRLIPFVNQKTKEYTIKEVIDGIAANQRIHLKLNYSNIYNNRNKLELENTYIYELLKLVANEIETDNNNNYWETIELINKVNEANRKVYLSINTDANNFKEGSINKKSYFNHYIFDLMERINYGERINNKFLEKLSKNDVDTYKILLGYYNIRHKIKANIRFIENKSYDEINFNNYRKDILKFIDIYNDININSIKKYLFVREDTKIPNIETYPDDRKVFIKDEDNNFKEEKLNVLIKEVSITDEPYKYYLINLEELNKIDEKESNFNFMKPFLEYLNDKYQMDIKTLDDFYKSVDVKQNDEISKIIDNYNYIYIKIIIVILILVTIILHVFYQEFIRYIR